MVFHVDEGTSLNVGDQVTLIPSQQDATVSRWDHFIGIRSGMSRGRMGHPSQGLPQLEHPIDRNTRPWSIKSDLSLLASYSARRRLRAGYWTATATASEQLLPVLDSPAIVATQAP